MKGKEFFNNLHRGGKLKLVEPSEEIKGAYIDKSDSFLASAKLLLDNGRLEETVSMAYYSMYYMVIALFFRTGIRCDNHTAAAILLEEIFGIDNSDLTRAKKERIDKQYYVDFAISRLEVQELIETAERFNSMVLDFIERLNSGKVADFRKKTKALLKH